RYERSDVGLNGMHTDASAGLHGFCHGAPPFSSIVMMRSVTSWRKSRFGGIGVVSVVKVAIMLFLLLGAVFGLGFRAFQAGTGQRLATNQVQESLDASIKVICILHVASNHKEFGLESPKKNDASKY